MVQVIEAMREADNIEERDDYISRVKEIFIEKILEVDPLAHPENTGYFNHSAVPDFVLTWGSHRGAPTREVFLRRSYEEIAGWRDVEHLSATGPVIVSLLEEVGSSPAETVVEESLHSAASDSEVLVAGGLALDALSREAGDAPGGEVSPLQGMLQRQVLRSGRGLMDAERANALLYPTGEIGRQIQESFSGEAARELVQSAELIAAVLANNENFHVESGRLSKEQVKSLLPWILRMESLGENLPLWRELGSQIDLESLEEAALDLEGLDLTRLFDGSWANWKARRGYLGLSVDGDVAGSGARWAISGGLLTCTFGADAFRFSASDSRRIKGRDSTSSATWDRVGPRVPKEFRVVTVRLRGVDKTVTLSSQEGGDLRRDIPSVINGVDTNLFVDSLELRKLVDDEEVVVFVDLGKRLVTGTNSNLSDLGGLLAGVVDYGRDSSARQYFRGEEASDRSED